MVAGLLAVSARSPMPNAPSSSTLATRGRPFDYLSDHQLSLTRAMRLPTFEFPAPSGEPTTLIRRMSWYVAAGRVARVWYPVFPPNQNAATVLAWLQQHRS